MRSLLQDSHVHRPNGLLDISEESVVDECCSHCFVEVANLSISLIVRIMELRNWELSGRSNDIAKGVSCGDPTTSCA